MELILPFIFLLIFFSFNLGTDYFSPKWWFLTQSVITLISYHVYLQSNLFLSLVFFYMMSSSAYYSINLQKNHIARAVNNSSFDVVMFRSLLSSMIFAIIFILLPSDVAMSMLQVLPVLLLLGAVLVFIPIKHRVIKSHLGNNVVVHGFSVNSSIDNTFVSLGAIASLAFFDENPLIVSFCLLVIAASMIKRGDGSAGVGGLLIGLMYFFGIHKGFWYIFPISLLGVFFIWYFFDRKLFDDSGRFVAIRFFHKHLMPIMGLKEKIFGLGVGSFLNMGHTIQKVKKAKEFGSGGLFLWLHCDVLQAFYEGGAVLLLLVSLLILSLALGGNPVVIAYILCWLVNSLTYFPNHMAPDQFLNLLILKLAFS